MINSKTYSNIKIVVSEGYADFNADVSVIKNPIDYGVTPVGRPEESQIKNPEIVVEVLSKSTRKFDEGEKLAYYKLIPSLHHILLVDQARPFASVYSRMGSPDEWLNHDCRTLESVIRLGDLALSRTDLARLPVSGWLDISFCTPSWMSPSLSFDNFSKAEAIANML